ELLRQLDDFRDEPLVLAREHDGHLAEARDVGLSLQAVDVVHACSDVSATIAAQGLVTEIRDAARSDATRAATPHGAPRAHCLRGRARARLSSRGSRPRLRAPTVLRSGPW